MKPAIITLLSIILLQSCSSNAIKKREISSVQNRFIKASCELNENFTYDGIPVSYIGLYSPYDAHKEWTHYNYAVVLFDHEFKVIKSITNESRNAKDWSHSDSKEAKIITTSYKSGNTTRLHLLMKKNYIERLKSFLYGEKPLAKRTPARCFMKPYPLRQHETRLPLSFRDF